MMENLCLEAVKRFSLLESGVKTVTVALSGGADSMAMLNVLLSLKEELGITVKAAHLNHMIRGEEAFRDEEFVKEQCEKLGVELFCERADIPSVAKKKGISTELAAREVRYSFLERINEGAVATAHTVSDNLETVLFNLARGSAIDGLCGIPPKRGIFIRPIILCSRDDVEEYCKHKDIPFVTDSTNLCDEYTRNKIRHNIIPLFKDLNPAVEKSVLRMTALLKEDADFINISADEYLLKNVSDTGLDISGFGKLHPAVAKRVIKRFIETENPQITLENIHIEEVFKALNKTCKISLPKNSFANISGNKLRVTGDTTQKPVKFVVNITECENDFFKNTKKINNLLLNNLIDCDKIIGKSVVRTRQAGDSIRLKNRGCTKTLNRLFSEKRIPVEEREYLPVISDDKGVIWVYGFGAAQRCAVTENTKRVLAVKTKEV